MYEQYQGLSDHEVIESREKYGTNVINLSFPYSITKSFVHVTSYWLFRVFLGINFFIAVLLCLLTAFQTDFSMVFWRIFFIGLCVTMVVYIVALFNGHWNMKRQRFEVNIIISLVLILLYLFGCVAFIFDMIYTDNGGEYYVEFIVFLGVVFFSMLIVYFLQRNNIYTMLSFHQMNDLTKVKVFRNGKLKKVPRKNIVFGDMILIEKGDRVPADAKLIESNDLVVDESLLEGGNLCKKNADIYQMDQNATFLSTNIFRGCIVIKGRGIAQVFAVGDATMIADVYLEKLFKY